MATVTLDQLEAYRRDGYVVLRGLVDKANAQQIRDEVMRIMDVVGLGMVKLKQSGRYLAGSRIDSLINSPALLNIASELMEGPSTLYLPFSAVKSGGGGGVFNFHQDNQYTRFDGPGINLWFALSTMSVDSGCLQVVPGSHLSGTVDSVILEDGHRTTVTEPEDFVNVIMEPGDCVAFSRLTVHGSGANVTPDPRVAYAVQFHRNDVRATWDSQEMPVLLKEHPRWFTGPVDSIVPSDAKPEELDGH